MCTSTPRKTIFGLSLYLLMLGMFLFTTAYAEQIRIPMTQKEGKRLHNLLLQEALKRGGVYVPSYPYGTPDDLPLSTLIQGMRNDELDIFSAMTNQEFEQEFLAIYIPLYKGMMGMRLAIVKRANADMFSKVEDISDLQHFTAGQGTFWADSKILEANNLPLVRELKYPNLFPMLEAQRFDYFPRGIHEPWQEVETYRELNLVVDEHIMLWYTAPFYFFVKKDNQHLAKHLTEQLLLMVADGTFQKFFEKDADVMKALSLANIDKRKIIRLRNPFLTPETPINNKALWFDPNNYQRSTH